MSTQRKAIKNFNRIFTIGQRFTLTDRETNVVRTIVIMTAPFMHQGHAYVFCREVGWVRKHAISVEFILAAHEADQNGGDNALG